MNMLYALTFLFGYFVGSFVFVLKFKQRTEDLKKQAYKDGIEQGKIMSFVAEDDLNDGDFVMVSKNKLIKFPHQVINPKTTIGYAVNTPEHFGPWEVTQVSDLKYEVGDGGGKGVY